MPIPFIPPVDLTPNGSDTIRIKRAAVAEHWSDIQRHKWLLSERLGRDVGTRLAALDYFENIHPIAPPPGIAGRLKSCYERLASTIARNSGEEAPESIFNFERVMGGTRSLAK